MIYKSYDRNRVLFYPVLNTSIFHREDSRREEGTAHLSLKKHKISNIPGGTYECSEGHCPLIPGPLPEFNTVLPPPQKKNKKKN